MSKNGRREGFIGRALPRLEDARLVSGAGRYTDDIRVPGEAYAAFVRSPHAHAGIRTIGAARARAMRGVLALLTGTDYRAAGLAGIRQLPVPADVIDHRLKAFGSEAARAPFDTPVAKTRSVHANANARGNNERSEARSSMPIFAFNCQKCPRAASGYRTANPYGSAASDRPV